MRLDTPIHAVMTSLPRTIDVNDTLTDARTWMLNGGFHHVPVTREGRLVGILSSSDLRLALEGLPTFLLGTGVVLDESRTVESLMTPDPVWIDPEAIVRDAAELLATGRYHGLPVVSADGVVGMVTSTDLIRWMLTQD